ncbi:LytR/AlgR family response regulator transcription factor [Anaeromicropila herbilytica]|uniref:Stage 0 sporulation protein A homolog n=1 Tax=Anaeromicropila herbilytica TaxID=2785025 RepID=A0A7R7EMM7_9FIRM|nr:LytTR family DNA-binding domain-containing protein [Anaeromicropila herbilytica]BCN31614.1 DNA-binding response regulator [Anaeromicropila herbilytica]
MCIKIGICDDRAEDIKNLTETLYGYDASIEIISYQNGDFLLEDCKEQKVLFDIIFLDIYMPRGSGIELASKIRDFMADVKIVFVSSSNEHYSDAYDVFAFNYILKPLNKQKLYDVLEHALLLINKERHLQIQFSYKGVNYRVNCKDILYIESRDKKILIHTVSGIELQCYSKLDEIMKQLPKDSFIRCHQSYAVNLAYTKEMNENYFCINDIDINISRKYRKESKDKYFEYLFKYMS